ncbi:hypothetical protein [Pyrococcus kukulkanii]|uniref:hypothetical protein n=1 Tax=Pyrococcus kukulkanii TaxID=1609559 RepID=UPI00356AAA8F
MHREVFVIAILFLLISHSLALNQGYDWDGLIKITKKGCEVIKSIDPTSAEKVSEILKSANDPESIVFASNKANIIIVRKLSAVKPVKDVNTLEGEIKRLEYYAEILNDSGLRKILNSSKEYLREGNYKAAKESLKFAHNSLQSKIESISLKSSPGPQEELTILLQKYNSTIKYAIQVAVALPDNESRDILVKKVSIYEGIVKEAENLRSQGRDIEALSILVENLDSLISFQHLLEEMHIRLMKTLLRDEGKVLILKLKIAAKKERESELRNMAITELELAGEDISLGRMGIATLRVTRASRIINYLTRVGGTNE